MKKLIMFLIITLFPVLIYAKEYTTDDIKLKVNVDDDFIVFTRDNLDNNSDLSELGITKESMEGILNNNNIYLDIIKKDISYEILVIVPNTKNIFNNFANLTDTFLENIKGEYIEEIGAEISSIYKTKYNYILVDYYDAKTGYYIVNYYTVVNANGYNFQLQKRSEITEEEKQELKKIVDSVEIEILNEYKEETPEIKKNLNNKKEFNYMTIVYGALIGGAVGLISYLIVMFIQKKKSSV